MPRLWTSEFVLDGRALLAKKTGHHIPLDGYFLLCAWDWLCFYLTTQAWRLGRVVAGRRRTRIAFLPEAPRPWYLVWAIAHTGTKLVSDPDQADILMWFDDATWADCSLPQADENGFDTSGRRVINVGCKDISKSRVDAVFRSVADYGVGVDPTTHQGPMVVKSEINAVHDGRILVGPVSEPKESLAYQRLVDNQIGRGLVEDLRTCVVGGDPVVVFRKRRQVSERFGNSNVEVELASVKTVFSGEEIELIRRFAKAMRLDWGGLDILRDSEDGRLYIVDANKTDMGPPFFLPLRDKLRAVSRLSAAFATRFTPHDSRAPAP